MSSTFVEFHVFLSVDVVFVLVVVTAAVPAAATNVIFLSLLNTIFKVQMFVCFT